MQCLSEQIDSYGQVNREGREEGEMETDGRTKTGDSTDLNTKKW